MMTTKGPTEIKWLSKPELASTKIIYDPKAFGDWAVEPYKAGLVAFTKAADGTRQLTLFCSARRMKFILTARGGAYANNFVASVGDAKEIEVAGMKISKPNFKMSDKEGGAIVSGEWTGTEVQPEYRSTFSLFGEVVGSLADLYSIYGFNGSGFQQTLSLARKTVCPDGSRPLGAPCLIFRQSLRQRTPPQDADPRHSQEPSVLAEGRQRRRIHSRARGVNTMEQEYQHPAFPSAIKRCCRRGVSVLDGKP